MTAPRKQWFVCLRGGWHDEFYAWDSHSARLAFHEKHKAYPQDVVTREEWQARFK